MKPLSVGQFLKQSYMEPLGLSPTEVADALKVNKSTLSRLLSGKAACSVSMAKRLAKAFNTSEESWLNIQRSYEIYYDETDVSKVKILWEGSDYED